MIHRIDRSSIRKDAFMAPQGHLTFPEKKKNDRTFCFLFHAAFDSSPFIFEQYRTSALLLFLFGMFFSIKTLKSKGDN
ncbi:hypothetical protein CEXT_231151 [Caerostris extrusa]|uniref:Uncharacterized protein n=1 Tax=Caerostris extrusa TaxID=172846 RepID=A0AAV4R416_CAEEX|nr:hypothetical protein CEXT_231151 [Caerostris extrusa]